MGAFKVLDNAKKCADEHPGFSVFDEWKSAVPWIRSRKQFVWRSGSEYPEETGDGSGEYREIYGVGSFTIVDEADGVGASCHMRKSGMGGSRWIL